MASYLDLNGLTHFKQKQDAANDSKYLKESSLDEVISEKLLNVYRYKGTVDSVDLLPKTENSVGDVYDVAGGMNYAWDGNKWDALGESKVDITIDPALNATSTNPVQNKAVYEALEGKASIADASKVTQTATNASGSYPILAKGSTGTTTTTDTTTFVSGVTLNPSSNTIKATTFEGALKGNAETATKATSAATADKATKADSATTAETATSAATADNATTAETATKLGGATVGGTTKPIYLDGGTPKALSTKVGDTGTPIYSNAGTLTAVTAVDVAHGGTGATTAEEAWTALGGGDIGKMSKGTSTTTYLRNDGTWGTPPNTTYSAITNTEIDSLFE